jgi:hypothetical protein
MIIQDGGDLVDRVNEGEEVGYERMDDYLRWW